MLEGGNKQISATVNDLSVAGALIESAEPLGAVGDRIEIRISTQFEARKTELKIPAVIRHAAKWDPNHSFRSGVEFADITREDKLVLYYLLFTLALNER
jgi:c-di-GMP-binding flagellar brake protein YcgR